MAGKNKQQALAVPDEWMQLLSEADRRKGFPEGTMYAVMQKESGGKLGKFLQDPTAYHYGLDKNGKRTAGHTGKTSTAFGLMGILESTAKDPGYGVKPLADKSVAEQIRFASDYLAARSKGNLKKGLAAYGEGAKYASSVASNIPGGKRAVQDAPVTQMASAAPVPGGRGRRSAPVQTEVNNPLAAPDATMVAAVMPDRFAGTQSGAPVPTEPAVAQMAQAPVPVVVPDAPVLAGDVMPTQVAAVAPVVGGGNPYQVNSLAAAYGNGGVDPWMQFQKSMQAAPIQVADLNYGSLLENTRLPTLSYKGNGMGGIAPQPSFNPFAGWSKLS